MAEAEEIRTKMAKEQKRHEWQVMNVPGNRYNFNLDEFNYDEHPELPDVTLGED